VAASIRRAREADAAPIAELLGRLGYPSDADRVRAGLRDWHTDPRGLVLVADVDGAVAGLATLYAVPYLEPGVARGRLTTLVVDGGHRGRGLGGALVTHAEEAARRLGCRDMEITSAREREAALGLYARLGYVDTCDSTARLLKPLGD
jgi:ribosomal protein S18 acetylase RimI-like enzyme